MKIQNQEKLISLSSSIISDFFPNEKELFDTYSPIIIEKAKTNNGKLDTNKSNNSFEFGESIISTLEIISTIFGTYQAVIYLKSKSKMFSFPFKKKKKEEDGNDLIWKNKLIEMGMDENIADKIVEKYSSEFKSLVDEWNN